MLLHIAHRRDWDAAVQAGVYRIPTGEGFIHLSTEDQVCASAARWFAASDDVVLLTVDAARVAGLVRWEESPHGGSFPHLYGDLALDAVLRAEPWRPDATGEWRLTP